MKRTLTTLLLLLAAAIAPYQWHKSKAPMPAQVTTADKALSTLVPETPTLPPLSDRELLDQLAASREVDGYHFASHSGKVSASNPRQGFSCQFTEDSGSLRLEPLHPRETWSLTMRSSESVPDIETEDGKVTLKRGSVDEWFVNDTRGLEHGFTLSEPAESDQIRMDVEIATELTPSLYSGARSVAFHNADGEQKLLYQGLLAYDSGGRDLPAHFELSEGNDSSWELAIHVDAADAQYPVVIDPVFTSGYRWGLSGKKALDGFGYSVAMSGDLVAVGTIAPEGFKSGVVDLYHWVEPYGSLAFIKRIVPSHPVSEAQFGFAVDLDADTLVVGAVADDELGADSGAVYVFERDAGGKDNWGEVARLLSQSGDLLGNSVGINGGILAAGAPGRNEPGALLVGATLVSYRTSDGTWSPLQDLEINGLEEGDQCGVSVAVSGQRIACGVLGGDTNVTPDNVGSVVIVELEFDEFGDLSGSSSNTVVDANPMPLEYFGAKLAMSGSTLFVSAPLKQTSAGADVGTVSRFELIGNNWVWQQLIVAPDGASGDFFGRSLDFSGDTLIIGCPIKEDSSLKNAGAVYVFERYASETQPWSFAEKITASTPEGFAQFGVGVAVSGDHFVVSTPYADHSALGADVGHVYTYSRRPAAWQILDEFHTSEISAVATDGVTVAYGIPERHGSGDVTIFERIDDNWITEGHLNRPVSQPGERFGYALAVAGEWMLAGSPSFDSGAGVDAGRAYLYRRDGSNSGWDLVQTFASPAPAASGQFGFAVALTSRWAFIGEPGSSTAYVFDRYKGGAEVWDLATTIDESATGGGFGSTITTDGKFAAIGAPRRAGAESDEGVLNPVPRAGQVILYQITNIGFDVVWEPFETLPKPGPDGSFGVLNGEFGASLALDSDLLVVGEPGFTHDTGRVSVFEQNEGGAGSWGLLQTLNLPDAQPGDRFGESTGATTRWIFAGAPGRQVSGAAAGALSSYDRLALNGTPVDPSTLLDAGNDAVDGGRFGALLDAANGVLIGGGAGNALGVSSLRVYAEQRWSWLQQGNALGSAAAAGDQLGYAVAVDGEWMVASAPFDEVAGNLSAGSIQLYRRSAVTPSGWSFVKNLVANDVTVGAQLGFSLDIQGNAIAAGAPEMNGKGAVYVFERNEGGLDNWGQSKKLSPFLVLAGDQFGTDVAIDDSYLVAGARGRNLGGAMDAGIVFVFDRATWAFLQTVQEPAPEAFDFFGATVDVDRGRILVGASLADDNGNASGSAYVFQRPNNGTQWELLDTLHALDAEPNDLFGFSVSLDRHALIGAPGEDDDAPGAGAAYVFSENADYSAWVQDKKLSTATFENAGTLTNLEFGRSVGIKDENLVVGASGADLGATANVGAVYLFKQHHQTTNRWGLVRKFHGEGSGMADQMGWSAAVDYDVVVAGAPLADQGAQTDAGYVYIFGDVKSAYEVWLRRNLSDPVVNDPTKEETHWGRHADPDDDGLTNVVEAYMNTDPTTANTDSSYTDGYYQDDELVIVYRKGKESNGAIGAVKWSRNLTEWYGEGLGSEVDIEERVVADEPDHFMIESRATCPPEWERVFLRVEVTVP